MQEGETREGFRKVGGSEAAAKTRDLSKYHTSRDSATRFSTSGFFINQSPQSPSVSHQGRFKFFRKFGEIFAAQDAPRPVSLTLVANLLQVSTTSAVPVANVTPVSLIPMVYLDLRISPRIFEKIRIDPNVIFRSWGGGGTVDL
jgi:hypothetical protein